MEKHSKPGTKRASARCVQCGGAFLEFRGKAEVRVTACRDTNGCVHAEHSHVNCAFVTLDMLAGAGSIYMLQVENALANGIRLKTKQVPHKQFLTSKPCDLPEV